MPVKHVVRLETQRYQDRLRQRLLELREREAIPLTVKETRQGNQGMYECEFLLPGARKRDQSLLAGIQKYYLAKALAEVILAQFEREYLGRVLRRESRLTKAEVKPLLAKALAHLAAEEPPEALGRKRKDRLTALILDCLKNNERFHIEGFLRFRAGQYIAELDTIVRRFLEEQALEKEYLEFIQLLKRFVDTQSPKIKVLHIGINQAGKPRFFNDEGKRIPHKLLDDVCSSFDNPHISYEDLLVSTLISVAPLKIILHVGRDRRSYYRNTLETIRRVFEERVSYCEGCAFCREMEETAPPFEKLKT
ncbi:MAG: putative sporulation protein YtxC [Peptococcaceae bacterium]|jgi:putative sporulation protein YtxC|nr:putative sporulation protein YtxC [Peptococcaceae bacterium]